MKKTSTVLRKHVFTDNSVYRIAYHVITDEKKYGIMITSEKFRCKDLITEKTPTTTQKVSSSVMLYQKSFQEVLDIIQKLADNIVFPSDLTDIIDEML